MEKETNSNIVLILSLGAGKFNPNTKKNTSPENLSQENADYLEQKIRNSFDSRVNEKYTMTTYATTYDETGGGIKLFKDTPFVAVPLIEMIRPDRIVIVGSIRSAWSSLYLGLSSEPNLNDYREAFNIENGDVYDIVDGKLTCNPDKKETGRACGILTGNAELDQYEERLNSIFKSAGGIKVGNGNYSSVQIQLIRYGVNNEQQEENYGRFKKIIKSLDINRVNRVSFDISHSFRSLPLYNLVLLNYLRTIENYDIRIDHVFNGCFEAREESKLVWKSLDEKKLNNVAPILDLHGILDLLDLTDAVQEFVNTGNAIALTEGGDKNDSFLSDLLLFDWATQTNDFKLIEDAITRLSKYEGDDDSEKGDAASVKSNAITDRTRMILSVIRSRMLKGRRLHEFASLNSAEKRLMIAEWYQAQNRYGQAVATGIEAMRSMIVPYYLEIRGDYKNGIDMSKLEEDENKRRDAEARLIRLRAGLEEMERTADSYAAGSPEKMVIALVDAFQEAKPIRNMFAHNLKNETGGGPDRSAADLTRSAREGSDYRYSRETIYRFMAALRQTFDWLKTGDQDKKGHNRTFMDFYKKDPAGQKTQKPETDIRISGSVLLIGMNECPAIYRREFWEEYLSEYMKKDIFMMPTVFRKAETNYQYAKCAAEYLRERYVEANSTVIICASSLKKLKNLIPMLKCYSFKTVLTVIENNNRKASVTEFPKEFFTKVSLNAMNDIQVDQELKDEFLKADEIQRFTFVAPEKK